MTAFWGKAESRKTNNPKAPIDICFDLRDWRVTRPMGKMPMPRHATVEFIRQYLLN
jgi:hypothetical protein